MKSKDQAVKELLGSDAESIRISIPMQFHLRLLAAGRRRFGTLPKGEVVSKALSYAAARGLIDWEKELAPKGPKQPGSISKKK